MGTEEAVPAGMPAGAAGVSEECTRGAEPVGAEDEVGAVRAPWPEGGTGAEEAVPAGMPAGAAGVAEEGAPAAELGRLGGGASGGPGGWCEGAEGLCAAASPRGPFARRGQLNPEYTLLPQDRMVSQRGAARGAEASFSRASHNSGSVCAKTRRSPQAR